MGKVVPGLNFVFLTGTKNNWSCECQGASGEERFLLMYEIKYEGEYLIKTCVKKMSFNGWSFMTVSKAITMNTK
jgi:hypothetical protein